MERHVDLSLLSVRTEVSDWLACVAGAKRGGGGGGGGRKGKSPSPFFLPPYPLPPTPFDACYVGY